MYIHNFTIHKLLSQILQGTNMQWIISTMDAGKCICDISAAINPDYTLSHMQKIIHSSIHPLWRDTCKVLKHQCTIYTFQPLTLSEALTQHSGKAKVTNFDHAIFAHKNVFRLYISMQYLKQGWERRTEAYDIVQMTLYIYKWHSTQVFSKH